MQTQNQLNWNQERSSDTADFYTIGYSGRSIHEFICSLTEAGVACLVDVREFPVSMFKPAFSKRNLRSSLEAIGIEYLHAPDVGVPRDIRALAIGKHDRSDIWEWYDAHVIPEIAGKNLTRFFNAFQHPVALMCVELDPTACHRHRIALALESAGLRSFDL